MVITKATLPYWVQSHLRYAPPTGFGVHFCLNRPQAWPDMCAYYYPTLAWPPRQGLRISVSLGISANTGDFPT